MSKALTASQFFPYYFIWFWDGKYLFLWYPFHFGTVSKPNSDTYFYNEVCVVTENIWVHDFFLIVELMSWEYVNIWSICRKKKFGWAQHTQRNTKTKRTTIRIQNNTRAVSAFYSLSHYMHRDKPPLFLVDVWSFQTQQIQKSLGWQWWCWLTPIIPGLCMHLSPAWLCIKSHGETTQQSSLLAVQ